MVAIDAEAYAIKIYYDSNDVVAKQAAEVDDDDYRFDIEAGGEYRSVILAKAEKRADDGDEGVQDLDESDGDEGGVVVTGPTVQYFVGFRKYWYRVEFTEPSLGFYIDWDDGEDNSTEKGNGQWVNFDKPQMYGIVSHIYTKAGRFFPKVRVKNMNGFVSKYYTANHEDNTWSAIEDFTYTTLPTGQQDLSIISVQDSDAVIKFPWFHPTTLPPVAILKTDRKTVMAGIYNELLDAGITRKIIPTMVYAWYSEETAGIDVRKTVQVEVTYEDIYGNVLKKSIHCDHQNADPSTYSIPDVWKVVDCRLLNLLEGTTAGYLAAGERVYLRYCQFSNTNTGGDGKVTSTDTAPGMGSQMWVKQDDTNLTNGDEVIMHSPTAAHRGRAAISNKFNVAAASVAGSDLRITLTDSGIPSGYSATLAGFNIAAANDTYTATSVDKDTITVPYSITAPTIVGSGAETVTINSGFRVTKTRGADDGANFKWGKYDYLESDPCICNVSLGWPRVSLNDRSFYMTTDTSESRTRASNLSIPENAYHLWLDIGDHSWNKMWFGPYSHPQTSMTITHGTMTLDYKVNSLAATKAATVANYRLRHAYTNDPFVDSAKFNSGNHSFEGYVGVKGMQDNTGLTAEKRFVDEYRLLRAQVRDNRTEYFPHDTLSFSLMDSYFDYRQGGFLTVLGNIMPDEVGRRMDMWFTKNSGTHWKNVNSQAWDCENPITYSGNVGNGVKSDKNPINLLTSQALASGPENYILITNSERNFDRIFFGMRNHFSSLINSAAGGTVRLSLWYPAYDHKLKETKWRALQFSDFTKTPKADTSLYINGPVTYDAPDDWLKCKGSDVSWQLLDDGPAWDSTNEFFADGSTINNGLGISSNIGTISFGTTHPYVKGNKIRVENLDDSIIHHEYVKTITSNALTFDTLKGDVSNKDVNVRYSDSREQNITQHWDYDAYGLLIGVSYYQASTVTEDNQPRIVSIFPYDNEHSEVVKVMDPMHVSLNDVVVAQSVSWSRKGKYINITDRIGRSELRKIGAEGGTIRFGGIGYGDYATSTAAGYADQKKLIKYQQQGTPVYIDIERPNGQFVRFLGKILSMSEDVPTGRVPQKWAIEMGIEGIVEIDTDGTWLSDGIISIGGEIDDRPQFI